jgi:hypothetical protein
MAAVAMPGGACVPALAYFSHTFLHCAAGQASSSHRLKGLWAATAPADPPVPLDTRVLLLGDESVCKRAGGNNAQGLWLHLRLVLCRAVWASVPRRRARGTAVSSAAVIEKAVGAPGLAPEFSSHANPADLVCHA